MPFVDRADGAQRLLTLLHTLVGRDVVVAAIPRGAVGMGVILATGLRGELDLVHVKKLSSPRTPQVAFGAVDEDGHVFLNQPPSEHGMSEAALQHLVAERVEALRRRRIWAARWLLRPSRAGRVVVVVDDGAATGATMVAALKSVRADGASAVIAAVPVASRDAVERMEDHADRVVVVEVPRRFSAVGMHYGRFPQLDDDAVAAALASM